MHLAAAWFLAFGLIAAPPRLLILSPRDGAVLPMQDQARIEAWFGPAVPLETMRVQARVEAVRGSRRIVIAEGDLRSFESPDRVRTLWHVSGLPPGRYQINVTVTAGDVKGSAAVNVTLHPPPAVSVRVTSIQNRPEGTRVNFLATARTTGGVAIKEFIWTPGDGETSSRTRTGSFSHVYRQRGDPYVVWLEVNDSRGGSTLTARDLLLKNSRPRAALRLTNDCGCEDMTILVPTIEPPPPSSVYCVKELPDGSGCTRVPNPPPPDNCPATEVPFKCPLGSIKPAPPAGRKLGWRFEVVAKLSDRTNSAGGCTEGQYARGTFLADDEPRIPPIALTTPPAGAIMLPDGTAGAAGFTFTAVGPPNFYPPYGGPNYAADDYAETWAGKRHKPRGFRWIDAPSASVGRSTARMDNEFIVFVRGELGTCWCRFSIRQKWSVADGVEGEGLTVIDSHNCRVSNPAR